MAFQDQSKTDSHDLSSQVSWRQSLATRVGASLLLLTVVSLLALGGVLIWIARQTQQNNILLQQKKSSREVALLISSYIGNAANELALFEVTQPLVTLNADEQKSALENLLVHRRTLFNQIALLDAKGTEVVKVSQSHTFLPGELVNRASYEAFAKASSGQPYIGPVFVSPSSSLLSVEIAVPVKATTGQIAGVLIAEAQVVRLWQDVSHIEIGRTGYAYLVDTDGHFIAYQDAGTVLQRHGEDMRRMPPVADFVAHKPEEELRTYEYQGLNNQAVVGLYAPVANTSWAAIVELPTQEAYASLQQMLLYLIGLTTLSVVLVAVLSLALSRRILWPIGQLTASAQRIGAGNLALEIQIPRQADEVGLLARAFRQMQVRLRELYAGLEQQVAERTADLQRRTAYLEASAEVSHAAASILEPDRLICQVVESIRERFGLYYVGLFLVSETREWAVLRAGTGKAGEAMLARGHRLKIGSGSMIGWSIANAQARIALEAGADAVRLTTPELPDTRSEAALPLHSRGQVIGALTVQSDQPGAFDEAAIAVLQTMADQVAVALDNAHLFAASQAAVEAERRAYGELSREAWQALLRARPHLGYLCDAQGIRPARSQLRAETAQATRPHQTVEADGAAMTIPIKIRDQALGAVRLRKSDNAGEWTTEEIELMQTLIEQLGVALESARLYQDTQRRAARERALREITARVRSSTDPETVLRSLLREVGTVLNRATFVRLVSPEGIGAAQPAQTPAAKVAGGNGGQPAGRKQPGGREQPASEGGK